MRLASGGNEEMAVRQKFSNSNPDILMSAAYLLLAGSKDELQESYPDFAAKHEELGTDFSDMASINILYSAQDNSAYDNWAKAKQSEVISAIEQNPKIMDALQKIRAPDNIHSEQDIKEQYIIRNDISGELAGIYAKVYDMPTLDKDDVHLSHRSFDDYNSGYSTAYASAWSTVPGVKNDEAIFMTYNPVVDIIRGKGIETSDLDSMHRFLKTAIEEFQHVTDNIYGDKLLGGELKSDHPAFDHTSLTILNTLDYTESSSDHEGYLAQHVERTAKVAASQVTETLIKHIVQPETAPTPVNPEDTNTQPTSNLEDAPDTNSDISSTSSNSLSGFKI